VFFFANIDNFTGPNERFLRQVPPQQVLESFRRIFPDVSLPQWPIANCKSSLFHVSQTRVSKFQRQHHRQALFGRRPLLCLFSRDRFRQPIGHVSPLYHQITKLTAAVQDPRAQRDLRSHEYHRGHAARQGDTHIKQEHGIKHEHEIKQEHDIKQNEVPRQPRNFSGKSYDFPPRS
jgi:hypothetical protein